MREAVHQFLAELGEEGFFHAAVNELARGATRLLFFFIFFTFLARRNRGGRRRRVEVFFVLGSAHVEARRIVRAPI